MLETISEYCLFHGLSFDLSFFAKNWMIKLDNMQFSTGWITNKDLGEAFNEAKKIYESRKK